MNQEIQTIIQAIGNHILDLVGDDVINVIAYSEIENDVVSCSVFYSKDSFSDPIYKDTDSDLANLFFNLWLAWANDGNEAWLAACCSIYEGQVNIELVYGNDFNLKIDEMDRRNVMVEKYFGTKNVTYTL